MLNVLVRNFRGDKTRASPSPHSSTTPSFQLILLLTCARRVQPVPVDTHQIHDGAIGPAKAQLHLVLATRTMRSRLQARVLQEISKLHFISTGNEE